MGIRWSAILPVLGLILFTVVSYRSTRLNDELQKTPNRYFWWSSLRLDLDPLNQHPKPPERCQYDPEHCVRWDISPVQHVSPGWPDRILVFSALPAFVIGIGVVFGFSRRGFNEVLTFMVAMPILLFAWYFLVGWLIERWISRRKRAKDVPLKLT